MWFYTLYLENMRKTIPMNHKSFKKMEERAKILDQVIE